MAKVTINELTLVRVDNVMRIMAQNRWDRSKLSTRAGINKSTAATWLAKKGPSSNLGDRVARTIEVNLKLADSWLDRDRRGTTEAAPAPAAQSTLTIKDADVQITDMAINKFQRDRIMEILFLDN